MEGSFAWFTSAKYVMDRKTKAILFLWGDQGEKVGRVQSC